MGSISKTLKRVIPKEIQPILPIAASMFGGPLVGALLPSFGTGIGALALRQGLASGLTSAGVDLLTKGKVDPRNAGIAALMGGGGQYFKGAGTTGKFFGKELGEKAKSAFTDAGTLLAPTEIGESGKFELAEGIAEDKVLSSLGKSAGTAATVGGSVAAYDAAEEARRKYEEEMAGREADSAADRQSRIDYITSYMTSAGFSQAEIDDALERSGYRTGGRVGFAEGGSSLYDKAYDINRLALEIKLIDLGYGGFGGKELEGMSDEAIIKLYQEATSKANGGRIGYRIGGGPVKSFIAKLLNAEPSEEVMQRMVEERKKEILNEMFDSKAGTGTYSMKQMEEADKMATKQAMKELEEFKMRIGMDLGDPPEGSVADDMIDQIMKPREKEEFLPTAPPRDMRNEEREFLPTALPRDMRKDGGIMNLNMGGMPAEMDLRGGGFVPLGAKEKADDVPARLSKNEFVMTADAVRAAGGGSVNKGAKRMYDLMNSLEARV